MLVNISENSKFIITLEHILNQLDIRDRDIPDNLSDILNEFYNNTIIIETLLLNKDIAMPIKQQSVCLKTQPTLDYKMIFQG